MHTTTTTPLPALPGGRKPLGARNAAIAALGIVSAVMVAAGVAVGGDKPVPPHTPAAPAAPAASVTVTISPSSLGRQGVIEVRFPEKPAREVLAGLKAHGFRWNGRDKCWWGKDATYADSLKG
jgi:hypothetical protein